MKKPYLNSIEYIRGVSMLGVVAIHIGAQYLMNPAPNLHLIAILEIASRFSVPIFFFISAFGLFYKIDLAAPFDYGKFLRKRFKAVLLPYLIWSALYILHDNFFYGAGIPAPSYAAEILFFGLAKYQLYFLVILIWFYLLIPLWIKIIKNLTLIKFAAIFFLQIVFNYFSSYSTELFQLTQSLPDDSFLKMLLQWRLNYLVLHYVFIFLLGGILAVHSQKFFEWLTKNKKIVSAGFLAALTLHLGYFYFLVYERKFSLMAAVNTAHQLSPTGFLYTIAASIFLFMIFENFSFNKFLRAGLSVLGKNSYFVYLFHPLAITYLDLELKNLGQLMTATNAIIFYVLTVSISLVASFIWSKLYNFATV
ncbi:MAG: acyltransferase [Selenomonadaceae bacterium]|nr:acyltransferase [Selenomonadaceae bacterium]